MPQCPRCGTELPAARQDLCPKCLLKLGLPESADAAPPTKTAGQTGPRLPSRIGAYHVVDLLGEGGMGLVYLAEQTTPIRRRVAVKVIKLGMDTRQVLARFESESQALAVLNHPNIAKVFDAGATDDGRPYFVMEYVAGLPITQYCDLKCLSIRDRNELFV